MQSFKDVFSQGVGWLWQEGPTIPQQRKGISVLFASNGQRTGILAVILKR